MQLHQFFPKVNPIDKLFSELDENLDGHFSGLYGALSSLLLARLALSNNFYLLIVPTLDRAKSLLEETETWLGGKSSKIALFPPERPSVYDQTTVDSETISSRLKAMAMNETGGVVITTPAALCERFFDPMFWKSQIININYKNVIPREILVQKCAKLGYRRVSIVEEPGQFAVRGGLVDIFVPGNDLPIRLDYFGDELESIKTFSTLTQRTIEKLEEFQLIPTLEYILNETIKEKLIEKLNDYSKNLDSTRAEIIERKLIRLIENPDSRDLRELLPFIEPGSAYLWDFWKTPKILIETPDLIQEELNEFFTSQQTKYDKLTNFTPLLPPIAYYHHPQTISEKLFSKKLQHFNRFKEPFEPGIVFSVEPVPSPFDPARESFLKDLRRWLADNWAIAILIGDQSRFHALKSLLGERHFPVRSTPYPMDLEYGSIIMYPGHLNQGFISSHYKIAILAELDLYSRTRPETKSKSTQKISSDWTISQLIPGDLVVHIEHGIAEYKGIHTMKAGGHEREYLLLQYAGSDRLYVPTDQVHKVQKYIGMEGIRPTIHSLNSKVWENQKKRTKKSVENIAKELLELYAKRHISKGFAFAPDNDLQREMESRFPYTETPDQAKAIEMVKADMESEIPMDRLICGDVGYGKTEIAIRAAFKAVCSGKQVAVLAPTTILAFQHYQTFQQRLENFPVRVAMVSRFVPPKVQKQIMEKVKVGLIDILIGTHRLLSKDFVFKDLGLLIIDEEHRFGVKQKEQMKRLREHIDVLALSATPIPRTLQLSLSGIRQISIIDTPPENRLPIQTFVAPYDETWVKKAIINELKRGGQVFYVYNRVEFIEKKAAFLQKLVPDARILIAHGQMEERTVEKNMLAFIRREFDVLVSTTIIESGLDIPNVNTLIVDEAERLGLAQMYQLRGRVGRSNRQAWAYFFYSKGKHLTKEAYDRLATIEEHTALGSGFKIAMRDMQIRGAGNILGAEQSGHICAVGLTLYLELLQEAVAELKGNPIVKPIETTLEIPVTALFPKHYIHEAETRIDLYAKISRCRDLELLEALRMECEDRFGEIPPEAQKLFQVAQLRINASNLGITKISYQQTRLKIEFAPTKMPDLNLLLSRNTDLYKKISFNPQDPHAMFVSLQGISQDKIIEFSQLVLDKLSATMK